MDDRHKYRVWDYREKKMIYDNYNIVCDMDGDLLWDEGLTNDRLEKLDCTGLKDKNDKLIFESDIVRYFNPTFYVNPKTGEKCKSSTNSRMLLVEWTESYSHNGWNISKGKKSHTRYEIIGNKFENLNLLTESE